MTEHILLPIHDEMIRLGQALKLANLVEDGAEARDIIQAGAVEVNGEVETRRGRQLQVGDVFEVPETGMSVQIVAD